MTFPLFTSIKPPITDDELSYLRDCLASWRKAGFEAIAVNGPSETAALCELDLPVEFATVLTDGKPRIEAFLTAIRDNGARFSGIINSDCKLIPYPNLATNLGNGLARRAALAWRIDVGNDLTPAVVPNGLDAFFFDTAFTPSDDSGFVIGAAFWDTWFPIALAVAGAKVGKLDIPLLTHRRHSLQWNHERWLSGVQRSWAAFRTWQRALPVFDAIPAAWWSREKLNTGQLVKLSNIITVWIQSQHIDISFFADAPEIDMVLCLGGRALLTSSRAAEIETSTSWKITAPLRKLSLAIQDIRAKAKPFPAG